MSDYMMGVFLYHYLWAPLPETLMAPPCVLSSRIPYSPAHDSEMHPKWSASAVDFSLLSVIRVFFGKRAALSSSSGTIHSYRSLDEPSGVTLHGGGSGPTTGLAAGAPAPWAPAP